MAEVINTNVIEAGKKFVDFSGLDYFWTKAKTYIDGVDAAMSAKVVTLENTVGDSTKGLVQKVNLIQGELDGLNGGAGSITTQIENAITALDLPNTYEAKGEAAKAEAAAKSYADGLASNYDAAGAAATAEQNAKDYADGLVDGKFDAAGAAAEVDGKLTTHAADAVAHVTADERTAWNAAKTAIDTFLKDADMTEKAVDTLAELQTYMTADGEAAAQLVNRVANLEAIDHDAYVGADGTVLANAKDYADSLASNYDAAGAAAAAESAAKSYADGKFQVAGNYEVAGAAAQALADAKADAANLYQPKGSYEAAGTAVAAIEALKLAETYETKGAAADAQAAAIAQAKLDAAEVLKAYYTKTEVDNLLSTNSTGDRAYAKQYTDELFSSIQFAQNSEIDALFA